MSNGKKFSILLLTLFAAAVLIGSGLKYAAMNDYITFLKEYEGRSFIYKNDTIRVLEYDGLKNRFIVTGAGKISVKEIYKLKEVKSW